MKSQLQGYHIISVPLSYVPFELSCLLRLCFFFLSVPQQTVVSVVKASAMRRMSNKQYNFFLFVKTKDEQKVHQQKNAYTKGSASFQYSDVEEQKSIE